MRSAPGGPTACLHFRSICMDCRKPLDGGFQPFCADCGGAAEIEYDAARADLRDSPNPYVRFADLLPIADASAIPDDARFTPTVRAERLGEKIGLPRLHLKDETVHPTGTTKDRMARIALAYLHACGVRGFCTSSTGNSSTSFAYAIGRFPEMTMHLFTAEAFRDRVRLNGGGRVVQFLLRGATFVEAFEAARQFAERRGLVSERGFFNPGRREGLKLAFLEAAEQIDGPIDWCVQAVSSAMGVHGMDKGARELRAMGRIERTPRLLCVQQETCAPMVAAWRDGSASIRPEHVVRRPTGIAKAILRGDPSRAYPFVHRIVAESGGAFEAVSEREIRDARRWVEDLEGIGPCFSASAAVAGAAKLARQGKIRPDETVLVNLTGSDRDPAPHESREHWLARGESGWAPEDPRDDLTRELWFGANEGAR